MRILAMLVAMVDIGAAGRDANSGPAALPRHLHRFVLRLLRPAEAATRRLIIVAARGVQVKLPPLHMRKPKPKPQPRTILVLDRVDGRMVSVPIVLPEPDPVPVARRPSTRASTLPLFDALIRFGTRSRSVRPATMPHIRSFDDPRGYNPAQPDPRPSADDPLDSVNIRRRLEAIGKALDDLPGQAQRLARWQARRDAALADGSRTNGSERGPSGAPVIGNRGRRFGRSSPMRPGRPPGWRRKPNHDVYEVLNELHGLAVWARERPDTS